jgi:chromosome segregation ATPase
MEDTKRASEREREESLRQVDSLSRDMALAKSEYETLKCTAEEVENERDDLRSKVSSSRSSLNTMEDKCSRTDEELKETRKLLDEEKGRSSEWEMKHEERLGDIETLVSFSSPFQHPAYQID